MKILRACRRVLVCVAALASLTSGGRALAQAGTNLGGAMDIADASMDKATESSGVNLRRLSEYKPDRMIHFSNALSALSADHVTTRGINDVRLYAATAPGVVLIVTNNSLGSGSLISEAGLIITNLHVVGNEEQVGVIVKPRQEGAAISKADVRSATVVRRDQISDLALIQLDSVPAALPTIALGSMDEVQVGADVHAIGHPTGEAWTYTKGIVSQIRQNYKWHAQDGVSHVALVIQTQTPINPGNSGGPLLSDRGDLVGVNSFKGQGEGLNFAVSVDDVRRIVSADSDRMVHKTSRTHSQTCEPKYYKKVTIKDPPGTRQLIDFDCSGQPDAALVVPDDPALPIAIQVDPQHTGKITGVFLDEHRDGKFGISYWDTTGSGKADLKCYQNNGDFNPVRCEKVKN